METSSSRIRDIAAYMICAAISLVGAVLFLRHIVGILLPFLLAWALALAVRPLAAVISARTHISGRIMRLVVLLVLFALLSLAAWFGGARLLREAERLLIRLSEGDFTERLSVGLYRLVDRLPIPAAEMEEYTSRILDILTSLALNVLPGFIGKIISSTPRIIIAAVITLIASVYFSLDLEKVHAACLSLCPARHRPRLRRLYHGALHIAGTYVRAYLILMTLTAVILFVGFLVIGVDYALLLALIVALVDILPVLGVGTVLVPWIGWCLVIGDYPRAVGLVILLAVTLFVRQFAEPHILGGSLGVHPLLTLLLMYAGLSLGGVIGMLLAPALAVPLVALFKKRVASSA